jgi:hypothetical protein
MKYKVTFQDRLTTVEIKADSKAEAAAKAQAKDKTGLVVIKVEEIKEGK